MTNDIKISRELLHQIHKELTNGAVSIGTGAKVRALLAEPVVEGSNKCGRCGASTVEGCNYLGCYFLESGNGAPVVECQEPVAWIVTDMNGDSYFAYDRQTPSDKPLYTSPPAPVMVEDRKPIQYFGTGGTSYVLFDDGTWSESKDGVTWTK